MYLVTEELPDPDLDLDLTDDNQRPASLGL